MHITQQLVGSLAKTYGHGNPCNSITVHETANQNRGADAQAHANLQSRGNARSASWQYTVDDREVIQSFQDTVQCWHAGDGKKSNGGNMTSIAIEICVNSDGDFARAVDNAVWLVQQLMARHGIPLSGVVQHTKWSGKNCPTFLRSGSKGITWAQFIAKVAGAPVVPTPPKPTPPPTGGFDMATLPRLDWRQQALQFDPMTERVQSLLAAAECYPKTSLIDGKRGPVSINGLETFQIRYNCGDGKGNADLIIGDRTWESLLTGKKW